MTQPILPKETEQSALNDLTSKTEESQAKRRPLASFLIRLVNSVKQERPGNQVRILVNRQVLLHLSDDLTYLKVDGGIQLRLDDTLVIPRYSQLEDIVIECQTLDN